MRRKVIEMGGKTLLISIPKEIAKKFCLSKGNDVEISFTDEAIHLRKDFITKRKLFLPFQQELLLQQAVRLAYQQGYDEIFFNLDMKFFHSFQYFLVQELPGFELIRLNEKQVFVKAILDIAYDDLEKLFRKIVLLIEYKLNSRDEKRKYLSALIRLCTISKRIVVKKALPILYLPIIDTFESLAQVSEIIFRKEAFEIQSHIKTSMHFLFSFDATLFYETYAQNEKFLEDPRYTTLINLFENLRKYLEAVLSLYFSKHEQN